MEDRDGSPARLGREPATARPKRFYKAAGVEERDGLFVLTLDGRPARTPAKRLLALPSRGTAESLAAEWNAQVDIIDPLKMPQTRIVNSAIDGVAQQMTEVANEVKTYLASDLVVYRAAAPAPLVAAESDAWDPVLDWIRDTFHVRFILAEGLAFVQQPASTLATLGEVLDATVGTGPAAPFRPRGHACDDHLDGFGSSGARRPAGPPLARSRLVSCPRRRAVSRIPMGNRRRSAGAPGRTMGRDAGRCGLGPAGRLKHHIEKRHEICAASSRS